MSALLKAGSGAAQILSLEAGVATPPAAIADPWQAERAALKAEIDRIGRSLEAERRAAAAAIEQARAEGMRAGAAEAEDREDARLAALLRGIDQALGALSDRLEALDRLAPRLARMAIAKLFDDRESWSDAVAGAVAQQVRALRAGTVVAVHVSPLDFGTAEAFQTTRPGNARIALDSGLRAGSCRIECKLGQIDLDLPAQLDALTDLLDRMATAA